MNLIGNALKFTHTGSVELVVRYEPNSADGGPRVLFEVKDTGIGMGMGVV